VDKQTFAAFLVAPLVAAMLLVAVSWGQSAYWGGIGEALISLFMIYVTAASGVALLAIPVYFLIDRFGRIRWWMAPIAGSALGLIFSFLFGPNVFIAPMLRGHFPLATVGALAGCAFWVVRTAMPNMCLSGRAVDKVPGPSP
jgi:hypothetical protein